MYKYIFDSRNEVMKVLSLLLFKFIIIQLCITNFILYHLKCLNSDEILYRLLRNKFWEQSITWCCMQDHLWNVR